MEQNTKEQKFRIVAIILSALLIGRQLYFLVNNWDYYVNSNITVNILSTFITLASLILVFVGLIVKKNVVSIGAFCTYFGVFILHIILSWDSLNFLIKYWNSITPTSNRLYLIYNLLELFVNFVIAIFLLLFLFRKLSTKVSLIMVSALYILQLIIFWLKYPKYIIGSNTLFSIITLFTMILTMLLYAPLEAEKSEACGANTGLSSYSGNVSENVSGTMFEKRSIALYIVLSFITCGIFLLIWLINIVRDVHKLHGEDKSIVGEVLLMLFIPFYSWYWMYNRGKQMYQDSVRLGGNLNDNSAIYLILSIFGLNFIAYALIQNDFNKFAIVNQNSTQESAFLKNENSFSAYKALEELNRMKENGLITSKEYERKKEEILSKM